MRGVGACTALGWGGAHAARPTDSPYPITGRSLPDTFFVRSKRVHPHQGDHKGPHPTAAQPPPLQGLRSHLLSPTVVLVGAGAVRMWGGDPCGRPRRGSVLTSLTRKSVGERDHRAGVVADAGSGCLHRPRWGSTPRLLKLMRIGASPTCTYPQPTSLSDLIVIEL
jgi:hypothetical protein